MSDKDNKLIIDQEANKKFFKGADALIDIIGKGNYKLYYDVPKFIRTIIAIASKDASKTFPLIVIILWLMEKYTWFNSYAMRFLKTNASKKFHKQFNRAIAIINEKGYKLTYDFEFKQGSIHRLKDKKNIYNNQEVVLTSFEDEDGISGEAPSNGGFFGNAVADEFVVKEQVLNPDKMPTKGEWTTQIETLRDNLQRFLRAFNANHVELEDVSLLIYLLGNPWGHHPEVKDMLQQITEVAWAKHIFNGFTLDDLLGNKEKVDKLFFAPMSEDDPTPKMFNHMLKHHTLYKDVEETGKRYIRRTKYSNPEIASNKEVALGFYKEIIHALKVSDMTKLMHHCGFVFKPEIDRGLFVYNSDNYHPDFRKKNIIELIAEGWVVKSISYGTDIDPNKQIVLTPVYELNHITNDILKAVGQKKRYMVHIGKQIELITWGLDAMGQSNIQYQKMINQTAEKHYEKMIKITKHTKGYHLIIDDQWKTYLANILNMDADWRKSAQQAVKHGHYGIKERQDIVQTGLNTGVITIDPANEKLITHLDECIKASVNDEVRKTSGNTNILDWIDSMEYGIYPYHMSIVKFSNQEERGR